MGPHPAHRGIQVAETIMKSLCYDPAPCGIRPRNVISKEDCGCSRKVANWEDVEAVAAALRDQYSVDKLSWHQTKAIAQQALTLTAVAETMCGGSF
jgi:hypothetical protein